MNRFPKIAVALALSLSVCFLCIGYAGITGVLRVGGSLTVEEPKTVHVSHVTVSEATNANVTVTYIGGSHAIDDHAGLLNTTLDFSLGVTVVLNVTIKNNTDYDFVYLGSEAPTVEGDALNTGYTYTVDGIVADTNTVYGTMLPSKNSIDVTVTYRKSGNTTTADSAIRFLFGYASEKDKDKAVVDNAIDAFLTAINSKDTDADGDTVYDNLLDEMAAEADKKHSTDYIGNVVGSASGDSAFINDIFTVENADGTVTNCLKVKINNVETNVTVMIKDKNIDYAHDSSGNVIYNGNNPTFDSSDNELVLYMTPETINASSFLGGNSNTKVTVYVVVFTKDNSEEWVQRGDMYEGKANANLYYTAGNYSGFLSYKCDSFNTETWASSYVYHEAATGSSIDTINEAYKKSNP